MKKVLILPDVHLTTKLPKPYQVVKKFIAKEKYFDEIILLGDFMDVSSLSHWIQDKQRVMEGKRYIKEIEVANAELDFLSTYTGKLTYIEGNHENWVEQYLDRHPEVEGLLDLKEVLHLYERGINWIPMNKLYKVGKMYFTHGMYTNKYHANKHLISLGCNICYGHVHRTQTDLMNMKMQEPIMSYALGCLCNHTPDYLKGKPANWICQFGIMEYDSTMFNLTPVNIVNNKFIYGGKKYD